MTALKEQYKVELVKMFVDGSEVDFHEMTELGLIRQAGDGFVLTEFGKSFLLHSFT